jgi:hypothetical protein
VVTSVAQVPDPDRAHPERIAYALVLLAALFVMAFAVGVFAGARGDDLIQLLLALVTTAVALLPLIIDQGRRPSERHVLLSTFSIVFIIGFVLPILVIFMPAEGPVDAPSYGYSLLMPVDLIRGQLATLLGLFSLLIGYAIPVGRFAPFIPRFRTDWSPTATLAVAMLMVPFGWLLAAASLGGLVQVNVASGFLSILGSSYLYGIALLAIAYFRHRSKLAFASLLVIVPLTSLFGLFTGSKFAVLIPPGMVVLAKILVERRIAARWIVLAVLGTALVYPVGMFVREDILVHNSLSPVAALRQPVSTLGRIAGFMSGSEPLNYLGNGLVATVSRMDCIGAASVLIRDTPRVSPFQYGRTLGLFFVAFIPRVIWPGKPIITIGQWFTDTYGSGPEIESSTAPSQLGEFFINFGYPGIIGGMLITGILLRLFHEALLARRPTTPGLLAGVVVLLYMGTGFQGNLAACWATMTMSIMPIILAHMLVVKLLPGGRASDPNRKAAQAHRRGVAAT